jgi:flagellar hook-basal body complex protein FliE
MPNPIDSYGKALAAYAKASGGGDADAAASHATSGFARMLKDAVGDAVAAGRTAEAQSTAAVGGQADLSRVVTAVAEAEMTLQTVVAVRERVIEAYKEILRMPI